MLSAIVRLNTLMGWTDRDDTLSRSRGQRRSEEARRGRYMSSDFREQLFDALKGDGVQERSSS